MVIRPPLVLVRAGGKGEADGEQQKAFHLISLLRPAIAVAVPAVETTPDAAVPYASVAALWLTAPAVQVMAPPGV